MKLVEGVLLLLLFLGVGLHLIAGTDYGKRNFEYFPDMAETPGSEAQDPSVVFRDGKTLQAPPPGVVPRGFMPLLSADGLPLESEKEWKVMTLAERTAWDSLASTEDYAALDDAGKRRSDLRGEKVFQSVCAACHGTGGLGGTPATKRGVPPPPSLLAEAARTMSDGRVFRAITAGQGNMPSHANLVATEDRWKVIRHIRALQESPQ